MLLHHLGDVGLELGLRLRHEIDDRFGLVLGLRLGLELWLRFRLGLRLGLVARERLVLEFRHELDVLDPCTRRRCRRKRIRDREEADLDDFLHCLADRDLAEAQVVADLGHGRARSGRDDDLPPRTVDHDLGPGQLGREAHPHVHRRHDGLDLLPLDQQVLGLADEGLDVARRAGFRRGDVGLEDEGSLVLSEELEDDRDRGIARLGVVGSREHDTAAVEPDIATAAVTRDAQTAGLVRRRQQAKDVDQRKRVERAL